MASASWYAKQLHPDPPGTLHLQGIGRVRAKPASELVPGDRIVYNYGYIYTVLKAEHKGGSVILTERSEDTGKEFTHRKTAGTMMGLA
jgi:hypothetical protein